jgi:hypothetical protein
MTNLKLLENTTRYRKGKKGVVTNIYHHMKSRHEIDFDLNYMHEFSKCKKFDRLFNEWVSAGYNKQFKPTIDRINHKLPYLKTNIQWLTWAENRFKQTMERRCRKGAVLQLLGDEVIQRYDSQRQAVIITGISQGNLSMALTGKRKYCGGYIWKYDIEIIGNIYKNTELL